jgi:thiamine monophosphate kinase
MAVTVEEVLEVWRAAERALNDLPIEAPERPIVRLHVVRLRRLYAQLTTESAPASWQLIQSSRGLIDETRIILAEARIRIDTSKDPLDRANRLMQEWLLAEQVLNRAGEDSTERSRLLLAADDARERYQAALRELEADLPT